MEKIIEKTKSGIQIEAMLAEGRYGQIIKAVIRRPDFLDIFGREEITNDCLLKNHGWINGEDRGEHIVFKAIGQDGKIKHVILLLSELPKISALFGEMQQKRDSTRQQQMKIVKRPGEGLVGIRPDGTETYYDDRGTCLHCGSLGRGCGGECRMHGGADNYEEPDRTPYQKGDDYPF